MAIFVGILMGIYNRSAPFLICLLVGFVVVLPSAYFLFASARDAMERGERIVRRTIGWLVVATWFWAMWQTLTYVFDFRL